MDSIFTELHAKNKNVQKQADELKLKVPELINKLEIKSIVDCGCGNFWLNGVDLSSIEYTGIDIVKSIVEQNQTKYSSNTIRFTIGDVCVDPPFDGDLWLARDLLCLWPFKDCINFFERFLESSASFIAITSIETNTNPTDGLVGIWKRINVRLEPFCLPVPMLSFEDNTQWMCKKYLYVYERAQIEEWFDSVDSQFEDNTMNSVVTRNGNLPGNISLKDYTLPL